MANFRFFTDLPNGDSIMAKRADYDMGANKLPRIFDENTRQWIRATRVVIMKNNPSRHDCDARCMNATGRTMQCECACGGRNHGKGNALSCHAA